MRAYFFQHSLSLSACTKFLGIQQVTMVRHDFSPSEISAILQDHVSRLSALEIISLQLWLLAELLKRLCDWVLGITFFWLIALLQSRCRIDPGRIDLQGERTIVRQETPDREVSGSEASVSGETEDYYWRQYFSDPSQWWDNRESKRNPKSPDFKHKITRKSLWIDGWYTPKWVKDRFPAS
jgi:hypothetical protein